MIIKVVFLGRVKSILRENTTDIIISLVAFSHKSQTEQTYITTGVYLRNNQTF